MAIFGEIDRNRKTAIYIRISTQMQQTDRQREELLQYAKQCGIAIDEAEDVYTDVISGFKDGETRPSYSILKQKVEDGVYRQILFSEFSRLDRNPSNLLKSIEYYQSKDVYLYFSKQHLWVRDKSDIATQIMVSILAVMSQYEIELFTARGIDGKISAIKNRGVAQGGFTAYGYRSNKVDKRLEINEEEADVVRRIYQCYIDGKSSIEISEMLNTEGVPAPYKTRIEESGEKRVAKGLRVKDYRIDAENIKWRPSTINRLVKNELYIGKRSFLFHEPDPSNPLRADKRKDRKLLTSFVQEEPSLCIVDDETFNQVQQIIAERAYNKNLGLRHDNLLKPLLRCGDCCGRYSVGGGKEGRKYKCYGTVNRKDKPKTCSDGTEVQMKRLDGLVIQLCIRKFADYDLEHETSKRIDEIDKDIAEKRDLVIMQESKIKSGAEKLTAFVRKTLRAVEDEEMAKLIIDEERGKYREEELSLRKSVVRLRSELAVLKSKRSALVKMKGDANLVARQNEIRENRELVKEYVHEFISEITLHRMTKLWSLVIVHFIDGGEMWGTVKNARYRKDEMFYDPLLCSCPEYTSWFLNNQDLSLTYDKETRTITYNGQSEILNADYGHGVVEAGTYTPEEFNAVLKSVGWIGSYPPCQFEKQSKR